MRRMVLKNLIQQIKIYLYTLPGILLVQPVFSQVTSKEKSSETVVFQTGFEEGNKSIWDDWDGNPDSENQIISDPGPFNLKDNHVIRLAAPSGERGGSDLIKVLPSQHDSLFVRWYIKYEPGFNFNAPNHGGGLFAGDRNKLGQSDYRPNGYDFAISTVEYNRELHTSQIYAYYRGMYQDCANPQGSCWGDVFPCTSDEGQTYCEKEQDRDPPIPPTLTAGKWYCLEMKLKMGTPSTDGSVHNGEIALWVDGQNYGHWDDLWIRATSNLKIGILWLSLYHHDGTHSDAGVLIDEVTVSTDRMDFASAASFNRSSQPLKIFPNPAEKYINVKLVGYHNFSVMLYDLQGRLLINKLITGGEGYVETDKINRGIYNMVVKDLTGNKLIAFRKIVRL